MASVVVYKKGRFEVSVGSSDLYSVWGYFPEDYHDWGKVWYSYGSFNSIEAAIRVADIEDEKHNVKEEV